MSIKMWGVCDDTNGEFIDISPSEKGCKRYATNHGYARIGLRTDYNVVLTLIKIQGKWAIE